MVPKGENPAEAGDRTRRRTLRTRRRLLEAALALFIEKGADAVTIEQITERADVGKGTFYRHFSSKDEVMEALVGQAVEHLVALIGAGEPAHGLDQALVHLLDVHSKFLKESANEFALLFQGRTLIKLERAPEADLGDPYGKYVQALERQLAPFTAPPVDRARVRRLACALAEFALGLSAFSTLGAAGADVDAAVESLRRVFVSSMAAFLGHEHSVAHV